MKKVMTLEQLNAINMLYDQKLSRKSLIVGSIYPALYLPLMMYSLYFHWLLIPIGFGVGLVYGYAILLPLRVKANYQRMSFRERNRFINNLAQSMHRRNTTVLDALTDVARHRLSGELKQDVEQLAYVVATQSVADRKAAYAKLMQKYEHDRLFVQFVEQLITVDHNGSTYLQPLNEVAQAHDGALEWQLRMIERKKEALLYFVTNNLLAYILCIAVIWITRKHHMEWFVRQPIGWVFGILYLGITFYYNHRFVVDYNDERFMEVKL